jgi:hypothetical protein
MTTHAAIEMCEGCGRRLPGDQGRSVNGALLCEACEGLVRENNMRQGFTRADESAIRASDPWMSMFRFWGRLALWAVCTVPFFVLGMGLMNLVSAGYGVAFIALSVVLTGWLIFRR